MPFHLATETTEELFEWYKVAWDITQREGTREFEVRILMLSHTFLITHRTKIGVRINSTIISFIQQKQQEKVEIRGDVAKEMSDLVVYCQPRSKDKDRLGIFQFLTHFIESDSRLHETLKLTSFLSLCHLIRQFQL